MQGLHIGDVSRMQPKQLIHSTPFKQHCFLRKNRNFKVTPKTLYPFQRKNKKQKIDLFICTRQEFNIRSNKRKIYPPQSPSSNKISGKYQYSDTQKHKNKLDNTETSDNQTGTFSDTKNGQEDVNWQELDQINKNIKQMEIDYFIDKPPTPQFKQLEKGKEAQSQVCEDDLYDYQQEVNPILQVLVGKAIERSKIELAEERER